jgi:hypothetical protein
MKERENKAKETKGGRRKERKLQNICLFIASVLKNTANTSEVKFHINTIRFVSPK